LYETHVDCLETHILWGINISLSCSELPLSLFPIASPFVPIAGCSVLEVIVH